ncbi:hypothetical protein JRO89_XS10G0002000 [Xanthoceras sorbifolium]|uniref:Pheophorbide a oxygenase n=1 Tax=Xanthoceras sorbifolium TaxID=99658 RepID=A0ABQ8HH54_9ROSI|nr:hypothetical protein JRO89_XS10G0002000 [Xanthoceras sorbifolium]
MEALRASSFPSTNIPKALHEYRTHFTTKPNFMMNFQTSISTENAPPPPEPELETDNKEEKFDWFSECFPFKYINFRYEVLLENILDPAHVPYAHYGMMEIDQPPKGDREGGKPLDIVVEQLDINGAKDYGSWSCQLAQSLFRATKSDAFVVGFRRWLNKYSDGQINWGAGKFSSGTLPPTPPRQQLMDRYWSHVVNCRSCNRAYKSLNAVEVVLQVISFVSIGIAAATKQSAIQATARTAMVSMAVIGFAASRWLAHFIYKNFHYHDYDHTLH